MKPIATFPFILASLAFAPLLSFAVEAVPLGNAANTGGDEPPEVQPVKNPEVAAVSTPGLSKKEKLSPQAVEVRLKDGSSLRGVLKSGEPIALKTTFGVLKFPMAEIMQVSHGDGNTPLSEKELAATLADFKGADADKRAAAEQRFLDAGKDSLDPLFTLRSSAGADLKPRVDDLLKRIYVQSADTVDVRDTVRATQFEAAGTLELQTLTMSSKLGDLSLKLSDVSSIRWIAHGDTQAMDLEATIAVREWIDTGIDAIMGEQMTVNCGGTATLFNTNINPNGIGNQDNQAFPFGSVIGKLGPDGEPFLIGDEKNWKPDSNQRLFIRIYASDEVLQNNSNTNRDRGHYSVRIACGPRPKDSAAPQKFDPASAPSQ